MAVFNYHCDDIPEGAINIMRPGPWGNPFTVQRHGRETAIALYRKWLWCRISEDYEFIEKLAALHGRDLVCCCKPAACHGDVLERAAAWAHDFLERIKRTASLPTNQKA